MAQRDDRVVSESGVSIMLVSSLYSALHRG